MSLSDHVQGFLKRLQSEPESDVAESLWYGIEIEFSDCDELGSGVSECPYDEDTAIESLESDSVQTLVNYLPGGADRVVYDIARQILANTDLETAIDTCTRYSWLDVVQGELDSLTGNWDGDDDNEGFADVNGWEHCEDGTSGIVQEYKTDEPIHFDDIVERVNELLNRAGAPTVPLNGSCHVHVSVPHAKHTASDKSLLHCCILWELSQFVPLFPARLFKRLESSHQSYFNLDGLPTQKYSAVSFHHQGSVEFRLFGAMTDADAIRDCIRYAGLAFLRGYARFDRGDYAIRDATAFRAQFKTSTLQRQAMPVNAIRYDVSVAIGEAIGRSFDTSDGLSDGSYASSLSNGFTTYYQSIRPISDTAIAVLSGDVAIRERSTFITRSGTRFVGLFDSHDDASPLYSPDYGRYNDNGMHAGTFARHRQWDIVDVVPFDASIPATYSGSANVDYEWHDALCESDMFRDAIDRPSRYEFQRRDGAIVVCASDSRGYIRDDSSTFVFSTTNWGNSYSTDSGSSPDRRDLIRIRRRVLTPIVDSLQPVSSASF